MKSIKTRSYRWVVAVGASFFVALFGGIALDLRVKTWHWDIGPVMNWVFSFAAVAALLGLLITWPRRRGSTWLMQSALMFWVGLGVLPALVAWPLIVAWPPAADALIFISLLALVAMSGWLHARHLPRPANADDRSTLPWPGLDVNLRHMELIERLVPLSGNWTPLKVGALAVTLGSVGKAAFGGHQAWVGVALGVAMGIGVSIYMGRRFAKGWMLRKLEREFGNGRLFDLKETLG
jgi:hypothetical protein